MTDHEEAKRQWWQDVTFREPLNKRDPLSPGNSWDRIGAPVCPCWDTNGCQTPDACAVTEADYQEETP